jgi:uncharacterized protein YndB with AHSA1/START domain
MKVDTSPSTKSKPKTTEEGIPMIDIVHQINDTHRQVGEGRMVLLRRRYGAPIEDVWNACTDPDRINRWFLPVTGDLHVGGTYQLKGNAGGEILHCRPPQWLNVTWVFGDSPASEVEVRLSPSEGGGTLFELEHAAVVDPKLWGEYGPGAVGVGWDLTLLGLSMHLDGESLEDLAAWNATPEATECIVQSSQAWGAAHEAAGATASQAAAARENTTNFYAPKVSTDAATDESQSG